ncbi:MAG: hypothetical protein LKI94_01230 [Sporolactobacillus sp.]|jgi:hypothetical protein|nr:hypothetical protein [Sporolactobacillus sp.]
MELTIVPSPLYDNKSRLCERGKTNLLATIHHTQSEIDRLKPSKLALDQAKQLILTQQLLGIETALELAGFSLIYR